MAQETRCAECGQHKPQMVYRKGVWRCSDCDGGIRDGVRVIAPPIAPTLVGMPSSVRLRTGLTHLPPTNRSWTR
jgi:hypothetical protein